MSAKKTQDSLDFEVETMIFRRLLVAVDEDDSTSSIRAFNYAVTLAKAYRIPLAIVTILETSDLNVYDSLSPDVLAKRRSEVLAKVNQYADKAKKFGVADVTSLIGEGRPGRVIVDQVIPEWQPDLLVVGSETTEKSRIFIGSQASYMAQNAPCSVIVVRANDQYAPKKA
ncbi:universal stress protein [Loigolactobacillus rennini]|uniref:Universal stress protein UspA family protein n=2 Tax=Loigolactobacillus rennini TaxID=238013 RepID=A0A0R2DHM8_9LACO|nr:universal stress protein [Loigolactobacillus rennini]KRM99881.1 universal stress protein UspA family protein [Loigolactobacillus rennini DSM 20253]SFZ87147.1 Universal stress protein family [Loigolactobacillus rennini]